jgi:hypothetical protein
MKIAVAIGRQKAPMGYIQDPCRPKISTEIPSKKKSDVQNDKFLIVASEYCNTKDITKS